MAHVVITEESTQAYIDRFIPYKLGSSRVVFSEENLQRYCETFLNERGEHK